MKRALLVAALAGALCFVGGAAEPSEADAYLSLNGKVVQADDFVLTPSPQRAAGWVCKWYPKWGKVCFKQTIYANPTPYEPTPLVHPWNAAAASYWGVWDWCHPATVKINWVNDPTFAAFGWAYLDGCWIDLRQVWLNVAPMNGLPSTSLCVVSNSGVTQGCGDHAWCAIVVHEWGHLVGQRFESCGAGWVHSCDPNSIMYYRGITFVPAGC